MTALLLVGCIGNSKPENPVERLGFRETTHGRKLVEEAAAAANNILGFRNVHRFSGSWRSVHGENQQRKVIDIFLIDPSSMSIAYSVVVPTGCNCVFVQPSGLETWINDHSTALPQMLAVQPRDIIAFMLLHELGHIEHGDPGEFDVAGENAVEKSDRSVQKHQELLADQFAVDQVSEAARDLNAVTGWIGSQKIQLALANLSWNTMTLRLLNHFGASSLCSRSVFADVGYSHPNFELRILTANYLLTSSPESKELLSSFQACR